MHARWRWILTSFAAALLAVLVAGLVVAPAAVAASYVASQFDPLVAGTESLFAIDGQSGPDDVEFYQVSDGTKVVGPVTTTVLKTVDGPHDGTLTYVTNDAQGLRIHGLWMPDVDGDDDLEVIYQPPILVLAPIFQDGATYNNTVTITDVGKAKLDFQVKHDIEVFGLESVDVPDGDYDAVKIRRVVRVCPTACQPTAQPGDELTDSTEWLARGMGLIKSEIIYNNKTSTVHTQDLIYSNKVYLPEPTALMQQIVGVFGLLALNRWRLRARGH